VDLQVQDKVEDKEVLHHFLISLQQEEVEVVIVMQTQQLLEDLAEEEL
jgi:hypothetical protein